MKRKTFNELIQKPLRFHHQDIHEELEEIKRILKDVSYQMQELRETIRRTSIPATKLPMPQPYEHPWWQYQWPGPISGGNNLGGQVQASGTDCLDSTGSGISGAT
jgi:hypothetical protein